MTRAQRIALAVWRRRNRLAITVDTNRIAAPYGIPGGQGAWCVTKVVASSSLTPEMLANALEGLKTRDNFVPWSFRLGQPRSIPCS